jgi:signal transduction histidine kinase
MSHELRTPLHTIIGFSDLLAEGLKGPLNDDQKRFVGHIQRDSMHLLELINQILDLSKIESGLLELRSDTFEMSGAVEEVLSSVRLLGEAKLIRIETELGARVTLTADRLRFKQILLNLLSNAVKFSPEGEKVRIGATCRDGFAEVAVSDNGIGVPESEHDSIFNKFYQVAVTTKNVREGTGLGLAITKALVEQHGGRIWLESEPGKGSCFRFTIPAQAGPEEGDAA